MFLVYGVHPRRLKNKLTKVLPGIRDEILLTKYGEGHYWVDPLARETISFPASKPLTEDLSYNYFHRAIDNGKKIYSLGSGGRFLTNQLLEILISEPNKVFDFETLMTLIWGKNCSYHSKSDRSLLWILKNRLQTKLRRIQPDLGNNIRLIPESGYLWRQ